MKLAALDNRMRLKRFIQSNRLCTMQTLRIRETQISDNPDRAQPMPEVNNHDHKISPTALTRQMD